MKQLKLYLETSVWNFLFADDAPDKTEATEKLFSEIAQGRHLIFISEIVLREINNARSEKRKMLVNKIVEFDPVVFDENYESSNLDSGAKTPVSRRSAVKMLRKSAIVCKLCAQSCSIVG